MNGRIAMLGIAALGMATLGMNTAETTLSLGYQF